MVRVGPMPGGIWTGPPGGYSLSAPRGHGKGALVLIAWELDTAAWQVEMALGPLACNSLYALLSWGPLSISGQHQSTNVLTFPFNMY